MNTLIPFYLENALKLSPLLSGFILMCVPIAMVIVALFQSPNNSIIMSSVEAKYLGIAGSINSLARNLGMVTGLSLSTTILYSSMSSKVGYKVVNYIEGRDDLFLYGMHIAFAVSFTLCLIAFIITGYRLLRKKSPSK